MGKRTESKVWSALTRAIQGLRPSALRPTAMGPQAGPATPPAFFFKVGKHE